MGYTRRNYKPAAMLAIAGAKAAYNAYKARATGAKGAPKKRLGAKLKQAQRRRRAPRRQDADVHMMAIGKRNVAYGRKPGNTLASAWNVLRANTTSTVWRRQMITPFGGLNGKVFLQCRRATAATASDPLVLPCHLFDITSVLNVNNGNIATGVDTHWQLRFNSDNTASTATVLSWESIGGVGMERTDASANVAFDAYANASSMLDWVSFKALFYCPTNRPTKFQVDICQFGDDRLVPAPGASSTFACAFWQAMMKRFCFSPLEVGDTTMSKHLKVLKSTTIYIDPIDNQSRQQTNTKELNLFYRLNRKIVYNWDQDDVNSIVNLPAGTQAETDFQKPIGDNQNTAHPSKRIFIMVRAIANYVRGDTPDTTVHPSFDYVLRMKHSNLGA